MKSTMMKGHIHGLGNPLKAWSVYSWMPRGNTRTRTIYDRAGILAENKKGARGKFLERFPAQAGRRISVSPVKRIS